MQTETSASRTSATAAKSQHKIITASGTFFCDDDFFSLFFIFFTES
jgi:hypothetical protein